MSINKSDNNPADAPDDDGGMSTEGMDCERNSNVIYLKFPNRQTSKVVSEVSHEDVLSQVEKASQEARRDIEKGINDIDDLYLRLINIMIETGIVDKDKVIFNGNDIVVKTKEGIVKLRQYLISRLQP